MNIKVFNGNNLPHELLLTTTTKKTKLRNAFKNNMSTHIKLCKTQISKINQSGGFLGSLLSKIVGPLMKVAVALSKNILAPLRITAAALAVDAGIQKKIHGSSTTTLIISNEEMNDIMKIVQALENNNILLKGVIKKFLSIFLGTLGASLLGNMLTGKGIVTVGYEIKKKEECWELVIEIKWTFDAASLFKEFLNKKILPKWA